MWLQIPLKIGGVFDVIKLGPSSTREALRKAVVELSTVFFFSSIFSAMQTTLATVLAERLATRMRKKLFRSIVAQELAFFDNSRKGELLSRLSLDISTAQSCLTEVVGARGLRTLFEVLGSTGLMLFTNWRLGLAVLALAPLGTWALQRVTSISATLARELQAAIARSMEMADERISQIRTVITFAQEAQEVDKFGRQLEAVYQVGKRAAIAQGALQAAFRVGLKAGTIVLFSYGGYLVAKGRMTVGTLLSYNVLNLIATTGVGVLLGSVGQLARVSGALERVAALMSRQPNPGSLAGSVRPDTVVGRLELRNLGFKYREEEGATWALKDVSFTVEPGSVVALVGPSGSGKSTLAALLLRLYEPTEGHVLLDGIPLDQLDPCCLRGQVGVVSQEPALFSGSIADNIAYARPEATRAEVMEAAAAANAEEFIVALPAGYDTQVGEKGASLSGGQRQRIAIARAVLKDPQILLLDEATSALDMESEVRVSAALKRLMKGRTTVLIAHRLSTVAGADWLVVLEKGRVREEGTPAQLALREGGLYQQMLQMAAGKGDAASLEMDSLFDQAGTKHETLRRRTA